MAQGGLKNMTGMMMVCAILTRMSTSDALDAMTLWVQTVRAPILPPPADPVVFNAGRVAYHRRMIDKLLHGSLGAAVRTESTEAGLVNVRHGLPSNGEKFYG